MSDFRSSSFFYDGVDLVSLLMVLIIGLLEGVVNLVDVDIDMATSWTAYSVASDVGCWRAVCVLATIV